MLIDTSDRLDLIIRTNNSYSITLYFDVSIASYTFTSDIANKNTGTKVTAFTVTKSNTPQTVSGITMLGSVTLSLTELQTDALSLITSYFYDLKMTAGGVDTVILEGNIVTKRGWTE